MSGCPVRCWRVVRVEIFRPSRFLFRVTAELKTHGRQNLACEVSFASGQKALVQRFGEDGRWSAGLNRRENGPAAFAGIGNTAGEALEGGLLKKRDGGEVEQPGGHDAAAAPDFGDVSEVEIVLIMFGIAQRRGFGVGFVVLLADIGVLQNVQAFRVRGHQAIFDSVVHHFHEMTGAGWAAVEIAFFGSAGSLLAPRSARSVAAAGSERFENGVEMADGVVFATDHLAIAALQSPDAAAGADIDVVNAPGGEFLGASNVVDVIRIAAVDDDVAGFELRGQVVQGGIHNASRNHQPDGPRLREFFHEVVERRRARRAFCAKLLHGIGAAVVDNALVPVLLQAAHHVGAHPAETDHAELHSFAPVAKVELPAGLTRPPHFALLAFAAGKRRPFEAQDKHGRRTPKSYPNAFRITLPSFPKSALTFFPMCTRSALRPRSANTAKSPRACAAFTTPKVYFWPGTGRSILSSHVICKKTPVSGPPL